MKPVMAPTVSHPHVKRWDGSWKHDLPTDGYVLESWSQGFLVGALIMMMGVTIANMTRALLHKLILVEVSAVIHACEWIYADRNSFCLQSSTAHFAS